MDGQEVVQNQNLEKHEDHSDLIAGKITAESFQAFQDLVLSSVQGLTKQMEGIDKTMQNNEKALKNQNELWQSAIEKGTNRCMAAIKENTNECLGKIGNVEERVNKLDDGFKALKRDVEQMQNRTVKATENIKKDEVELNRCRRTLMIQPVTFVKEEAEHELAPRVLDEFMGKLMGIPKDELKLLGRIKTRRTPPMKGTIDDAPVEVEFATVEDRDFIISRSRYLRSQDGTRKGSIKFKVPRFLIGLRQRLERDAAKIRLEGKKWAQVRFSDDQDMLAIYVKGADDHNSKWEKVPQNNQHTKTLA